MPEDPGADLVARFVQGDRDAFESLFRAFQGEVYRWAVRIVRDRGGAEEVVVEAFWRAYRGHARFDAGRSFGAWMRRIATNAARDHLRRARRHSVAMSFAGEPAAPAAPDAAVRAAVTAALRALSPKLQIVATLAFVEQCPLAEIADALDVPLGTVKSRLFRATRALRAELTRLGIQP